MYFIRCINHVSDPTYLLALMNTRKYFSTRRWKRNIFKCILYLYFKNKILTIRKKIIRYLCGSLKYLFRRSLIAYKRWKWYSLTIFSISCCFEVIVVTIDIIDSGKSCNLFSTCGKARDGRLLCFTVIIYVLIPVE